MALMLTRKVVEMAAATKAVAARKTPTRWRPAGRGRPVICQTGCVSHGAYWRVRDHCTRTGKECVLVDRPEALDGLRPTETGALTAPSAPVQSAPAGARARRSSGTAPRAHSAITRKPPGA